MPTRGLVLFFALALPVSLVAQAPTTDCHNPPAVAADGPPRVPIVLVNNHVYVEVCVAGKPLDFILDTGAGTSFFDLGVSRQLGLQARSAFTGRGAGAGTIQGARLDTVRVYVGGTSLLVQNALDFAGVSLGEGFALQGVLGYDFIARYVLAIDYEARELTLHDPKTFRYSGSGTAVPIISFDRNHPHIRAEVVVGGTVIGMKALVDVGASSALSLAKPFVEKHRLRTRVSPTLRTNVGGGVGGPVMADVGRLDALRIGPYTLASPVTQLYGDSAGVFSENMWDANIGGETLRRFKVFLDYSRKQIIFEPTAAMSAPFEADMTGLRVRGQRHLDSLMVTYVMPGSPADDAGIRIGDVLLALEGQPATAAALRELRPRLRRPGEQLSLSLMRGTARIEVRLTTRRQL